MAPGPILTPDDVRAFPRITKVTINDEPASISNLVLPGRFLPSLTDCEVQQAVGTTTDVFAKQLRLGKYVQEHNWLNAYISPCFPTEFEQYLRLALQAEIAAQLAIAYPILEDDMYRWAFYGPRNGFKKILGQGMAENRYREIWQMWLEWGKANYLYFRFPTGEIIAALPPYGNVMLRLVVETSTMREEFPSKMFDRHLCLGAAMFMGRSAKHKMTLDEYILIAEAA